MFDTIYNYSTFTRKQANIIYAAIKHDELVADKKFTHRLYDIVDCTTLSIDDAQFRENCETIISLIFDKEIALAQAIIDGKKVGKIWVGTGEFKTTRFGSSEIKKEVWSILN